MEHEEPRETAASRSPLQFSLRSMFVATAVVAVMCSLGLATPAAVAAPVFVLFSLALPGLLSMLVVYGRGNPRTFAIAAMFPAGGLAMVVGVLGIVVRRAVETRQHASRR